MNEVEVGGTYKILEARDHGELDKYKLVYLESGGGGKDEIDGPGKVSISENI